MANEQNLKPFKKGRDDRRNLKGQPVKTFNSINKELKAQGFTAPTKGEFYEFVGLMLTMTEQKMKDFAAETKNPQWCRALIVDINNKKIRYKLMGEYRDWLFGKASQELDLSNKDGSLKQPQIIISDPENSKRYQEILNKLNEKA